LTLLIRLTAINNLQTPNAKGKLLAHL